jgi:hypothetical protein
LKFGFKNWEFFAVVGFTGGTERPGAFITGKHVD